METLTVPFIFWAQPYVSVTHQACRLQYRTVQRPHQGGKCVWKLLSWWFISQKMNFISKASMTRVHPGVDKYIYILKKKPTSPRGVIPLVGKRVPSSLEMKFVNLSEAGGRLLYLFCGGVSNPPPQAFGFQQVSLFNLENVKVHGCCKLIVTDLWQRLADVCFTVWSWRCC